MECTKFSDTRINGERRSSIHQRSVRPREVVFKVARAAKSAADYCILEGLEDLLVFLKDYDNPKGYVAEDKEGDEFEDEDRGDEEDGGEEKDDIECISVTS
jgi:hypothetical protein